MEFQKQALSEGAYRAWDLPVLGLAVALASGAAMGFGFPHRLDYLGHYIAGYGGCLGLVLLTALARPAIRWPAVFSAIAVIAFGVYTEATIFRLAIFDLVDFFNQSLGAAVACCVAAGRRVSFPEVVMGLLVAAICVLAGFYFAFA